MITKNEIIELLKEYSGYIDRSRTEQAIHEDNFDIVSDAILSKLRQDAVSPRIDWVELRNNFFNECTTETPREESGKKVNMAPHDMFEWFKREISEYVG